MNHFKVHFEWLHNPISKPARAIEFAPKLTNITSGGLSAKQSSMRGLKWGSYLGLCWTKNQRL